jgi:branched-chain amino acid transport system substrate-binding protein
MERLCSDPDILIAQPTWGSSFAMAATEVTERLGIPSFTTGFSEKLHERGFKYGFYPFPGFLDNMRNGMPVVLEMFKAAGREIKTQFVASSNNVSDMLFCENTQKYLEERGIKSLGKEIWPIGTLTDASTIMQKIKRESPDIVIYGGSAVSEMQLFLMKQKELQLKRTIFLASSAYLGDPTLKFGGEYLDSWIGLAPAFYNKRTPREWLTRLQDQCRKEYSDEPWVGQELGFPMCLVPVYAEALERAASRDRKVLRDTISKLDIQGTMTTSYFAKNGVAFDETGRIAKKYHGILVIQWQGGKCITVYPPELATANPRLVF